jgi:hypothetical protein
MASERLEQVERVMMQRQTPKLLTKQKARTRGRALNVYLMKYCVN